MEIVIVVANSSWIACVKLERIDQQAAVSKSTWILHGPSYVGSRYRQRKLRRFFGEQKDSERISMVLSARARLLHLKGIVDFGLISQQNDLKFPGKAMQDVFNEALGDTCS